MKKAQRTKIKSSKAVPSSGAILDAKSRLAAHEAETGNLKHGPHVRNAPKVGRNAKCPCGSGKKYKNCHINTRIPLNTNK